MKNVVERAFQQLDPLSALTGRPITVVAAVVIPLFAVVMTWSNRFDIENWALAIAALVAITLSGVVLDYASSPLRAPFTLLMHCVVTGLAVLAYVLNVAAMWNTNQFIRDDWGPIAIGLVLLSLSQYRPPKEIASTGVFLALVVGVVALAQEHSMVSGVSPISYSIVAMTPVLSLSLASAAFGRLLIDGIETWRRRAVSAATEFTNENSDWIARSVQQDRVTILNQDVVPFFADVLQRRTITERDRVRAREISDAIRRVMVAEADRTWIDIIIDQYVGPSATVIDARRYANSMSTDQRTAVRALVVALTGHHGFVPDEFSFRVDADGGTCRAELSALLSASDSALRSEFAPYFAVMRIVFAEVRVEFAESTLTLRFSYDQR